MNSTSFQFFLYILEDLVQKFPGLCFEQLSVCYATTSHVGGPGSSLGHPVFDLWWKQ
jgi:hypothetical protein